MADILLRGHMALFQAVLILPRFAALFVDILDIIPQLSAFQLHALLLLLILFHILPQGLHLFALGGNF